MKDCSNCKYLCREGYEDYYYICELFGEDIPDWADNPNGNCCLLKSQEVEKMKNTLVETVCDFVVFSLYIYKAFTPKEWEDWYKNHKPKFIKRVFIYDLENEWELQKDGTLKLQATRKITPEHTYKLGRIESNSDLKQRKKEFKNFLERKYKNDVLQNIKRTGKAIYK